MKKIAVGIFSECNSIFESGSGYCLVCGNGFEQYKVH